MQVIFSEKAEKELDKMDHLFRKLFFKNIEKIKEFLPRRHLRFGLPFNVEEVTKQARIVYQIEENKLFILHCFDTHKEYEKWYKSFK